MRERCCLALQCSSEMTLQDLTMCRKGHQDPQSYSSPCLSSTTVVDSTRRHHCIGIDHQLSSNQSYLHSKHKQCNLLRTMVILLFFGLFTQAQVPDIPIRCTTNIGPCDVAFPFLMKYRYSQNANSCSHYLSCAQEADTSGPINSFNTLEECQDVCLSVPPTDTATPSETDDTDTEQDPTSICFLDRMDLLTDCNLVFPTTHYYYNYEQEQCLPFSSFGCSNENNFITEQACIDHCLVPLTSTITDSQSTPSSQSTPVASSVPSTLSQTTPTISQTTTRIVTSSQTTPHTSDPPFEQTTSRVTTEPVTKTMIVTMTTTRGNSPLPTTTVPPPMGTTGGNQFILNKFDFASIFVGMLAFCLLVLLVVLVAMVIYKQRKLKVNKEAVMDSRRNKMMLAYRSRSSVSSSLPLPTSSQTKLTTQKTNSYFSSV